MATTTEKYPKDEHITNKDDSVTNKDGDNYLEKGKQPTNQDKNEQERIPTVTPNNENGDPGPSEKTKELDKDRERMKHSL